MLMAKMGLGALLNDVGEKEEARALFNQVIDGHTKNLGAGHATTLLAKRNLASLG